MHTRWGVSYKKKNLKIKLECCDSQAPHKKTMTKRSSQEQQEKKRCDSFLIFRSKNEWKSRSLLCVSLDGCEWVLIKSGLRGKLTDNIKPSIFRELLFRAARLQRDTAIRKEISVAQWPRIPQHTAVCMNHLHSKRKMVESKKVVLREKKRKKSYIHEFCIKCTQPRRWIAKHIQRKCWIQACFWQLGERTEKKTRVENNSPVFQRARTANNADIYGLLQKNKKNGFFFFFQWREKKTTSYTQSYVRTYQLCVAIQDSILLGFYQQNRLLRRLNWIQSTEFSPNRHHSPPKIEWNVPSSAPLAVYFAPNLCTFCQRKKNERKKKKTIFFRFVLCAEECVITLKIYCKSLPWQCSHWTPVD